MKILSISVVTVQTYQFLFGFILKKTAVSVRFFSACPMTQTLQMR
jgi:hypothetical protein